MSDIRFQDYEISPETGFVPKIPASLPEYFRPWHELALRATELMEKKTFRQEADKLSQLDSSELHKYSDLHLAHLQLCIIAAAYTWQDGVGNGPKSLPANIAVPLCDVSDRLGLEAGTSSFNCNVQRIDHNGNARLIYPLPGGKMAEDFWKVIYDGDVSFGKLLPVVSSILEGAKTSNKEQVTQALKDVAKWVNMFTDILRAFCDCLAGDTFVQEILPFYTGFNEEGGYPDGMLYEGVTHNPRRKTLTMTNAQNPTIPIIETILGVTYAPEKAEIKKRWRQAWPSPHQKFHDLIVTWPGSVRSMAQEDRNSDLSKAYDNALKTIEDFRTFHIQIIVRYVVNPVNKGRAASEEGDASQSPMTHGLIPKLKGFRSEGADNKLTMSTK